MRFPLRRQKSTGVPAPGPRVAVVTDSTAMLPADAVAEHGVVVVPLQVVIDGVGFDEGTPQATPAAVAEALTGKRPVTTSRIAPATFAAAYTSLALEGHEAIVSVHLSGELSGTVEAARQAAGAVMVPVTVVDTHTAGPALGRAVLAAVAAIEAGGSAEDAAAAAERVASATRSYFYVDTLEYLRRGGRIGTATALLGSALAVKPLLTMEGGRVVLHERVRTAARAITRLEDLAVEAATALVMSGSPVAASVVHLASPDRAATLATSLGERLAALAGTETSGADAAQTHEVDAARSGGADAGRMHGPRTGSRDSGTSSDTEVAHDSEGPGTSDAGGLGTADADQPRALADEHGIEIAEASSVLGAHLGPGMLAVVVGPTP
jgi:DegV family protein with EDD domain